MTADKPLNRTHIHLDNQFCLPTAKMLCHALDWRRKKKTQFFPEKKFLSGKIRLVITPCSSDQMSILWGQGNGSLGKVLASEHEGQSSVPRPQEKNAIMSF